MFADFRCVYSATETQIIISWKAGSSRDRNRSNKILAIGGSVLNYIPDTGLMCVHVYNGGPE